MPYGVLKTIHGEQDNGTLTEGKSPVTDIVRPIRSMGENERLEEGGKIATLLTIDSKLSGIIAIADMSRKVQRKQSTQEEDDHRSDNGDRRQ